VRVHHRSACSCARSRLAGQAFLKKIGAIPAHTVDSRRKSMKPALSCNKHSVSLEQEEVKAQLSRLGRDEVTLMRKRGFE